MRLVSLDLDGTLIHPAVFNVVADALGFGAPLHRSYEAYLAGTMTLEEAFHHDFPHFVGRDIAEMHDILRTTKAWTPGIAKAVDALHQAGLRVILTTDQPRFLAEATTRFGVEDLVCSETKPANGRVAPHIDTRFAKWPNLANWLEREDIDPADVAHVGNGTNDIPVFQHVGHAVAVNPTNPAVANAADDVVDPLQDLRQVADLILARHDTMRRR